MIHSLRNLAVAVVTVLTAFPLSHVGAKRLIESHSLNTCTENSDFTASLFKVEFRPSDKVLSFNIIAMSTVEGNVTIDVELIAYGLKAFRESINPCENSDFAGLCPMVPGRIPLHSNIPLTQDVVSKVPAIAYQVPDLDGKARVMIRKRDTNELVACVEAPLSNGKTVYQKAVGWATALIAVIGLVASGVNSGLGHTKTAAHVAANTVSLFGFFQAQSMMGMTVVPLPPIVVAWTQNFHWSMGIIKIQFMQKIFHWYIKATGGKPSNLLNELATTSVQVTKRSLDSAGPILNRAEAYMANMAIQSRDLTMSEPYHLVRRATSENSNTKVSGMTRVAFKSSIEKTSLFMTGLSFFVALMVLVAVIVFVLKGLLELAVKLNIKRVGGSRLATFRTKWLHSMKGTMYRILLVALPQMTTLCIWELTTVDSPAAAVNAVFFLLAIWTLLGFAAFRIIRVAQRSVELHKNPAYILYSDLTALSHWGPLYVAFKASKYFYIVPLLLYSLVKGIIIATGQKSNTGAAQAIALLVVELIWLVSGCWSMPWMDKKTNVFNISIAAINFLSTIFLLIFTGIFKQPGIVTGVIGVAFFIINAVFALILLILVLGSSIYALFSKNPDVRYPTASDDRGSFLSGQSEGKRPRNQELEALAFAARGTPKPESDKGGSVVDFSPQQGGLSPSWNMQGPEEIPLPESRGSDSTADYSIAPTTQPKRIPSRASSASPYK